ncbi:hypothetical protein A3Q56_06080 [Intoshia linei]|uniref:Uncharacterized protein n=1 Tax=Intoshia linei TaxID=1819745 RepID=A0A177AW23_9BILA|nr:hypothetical protein A3Q56_06080 [Intoshia linei]
MSIDNILVHWYDELYAVIKIAKTTFCKSHICILLTLRIVVPPIISRVLNMFAATNKIFTVNFPSDNINPTEYPILKVKWKLDQNELKYDKSILSHTFLPYGRVHSVYISKSNSALVEFSMLYVQPSVILNEEGLEKNPLSCKWDNGDAVKQFYIKCSLNNKKWRSFDKLSDTKSNTKLPTGKSQQDILYESMENDVLSRMLNS